jgi:hypothetical protein
MKAREPMPCADCSWKQPATPPFGRWLCLSFAPRRKPRKLGRGANQAVDGIEFIAFF